MFVLTCFSILALRGVNFFTPGLIAVLMQVWALCLAPLAIRNEREACIVHYALGICFPAGVAGAGDLDNWPVYPGAVFWGVGALALSNAGAGNHTA